MGDEMLKIGGVEVPPTSWDLQDTLRALRENNEAAVAALIGEMERNAALEEDNERLREALVDEDGIPLADYRGMILRIEETLRALGLDDDEDADTAEQVIRALREPALSRLLRENPGLVVTMKGGRR